jgi:hypothetical protein
MNETCPLASLSFLQDRKLFTSNMTLIYFISKQACLRSLAFLQLQTIIYIYRGTFFERQQQVAPDVL